MPAPDYQGSADDDHSIGLAAEFAGLQGSSMSYSFDSPEVEFYDQYGGVTGAAINHNPSITYEVTGQVSDLDATDSIHTQTLEAAAAPFGKCGPSVR